NGRDDGGASVREPIASLALRGPDGGIAADQSRLNDRNSSRPASSASAQSSSAPLLSMSERKAGKMAAGGGGGERRRSPASAGLDARGPAPAAADDGPLLRAPAIRSDVIVQLNNIHKTYLLGVEGVPALRICRGEWVVVYGTSGGGKTSLLNIIGTVDTPTKGDLTVCGTKITSRTKDAELAFLRLTKLGFVFQTFNLLPSMTARENVELPMMLAARRSPAERRAAAAASLHSVGLSHRLGHFPNQLSGGEQQRVTIARAIANSPELLLLDEPTGDLDTANTNKIVELLHRLNLE
ncbi:MAG: P-loop containing nucleoside triphosphate hydrolase protein, partial [Olpidium bornovanus]